MGGVTSVWQHNRRCLPGRLERSQWMTRLFKGTWSRSVSSCTPVSTTAFIVASLDACRGAMTNQSQGPGIVNLVLAVCAVTLTVLVARRELFSPLNGATVSRSQVRALPNWQVYLQGGHRIGAQAAQVEIIEFADFECPACRRFATASLRGVLAKFPGKVAVVFHHWPLYYHHFAYAAARAAECAATQGHFAEFHDVVYDKQDSLGMIPFDEFARRSGVPDLAAFDKCDAGGLPVPAVEADKKTAEGLGASGTPTIIIAGELYTSSPDSIRLDEIVSKLLKGGRSDFFYANRLASASRLGYRRTSKGGRAGHNSGCERGHAIG